LRLDASSSLDIRCRLSGTGAEWFTHAGLALSRRPDTEASRACLKILTAFIAKNRAKTIGGAINATPLTNSKDGRLRDGTNP
jgi:predicted outer membrane repeat protein